MEADRAADERDGDRGEQAEDLAEAEAGLHASSIPAWTTSSTPRPIPEAEPGERRLNIHLDPADIAGAYANFANISFSRYEFTLTFARIEHEVEEGDVPGAVVSRINASPRFVEELIAALQDSWSKFQTTEGIRNLPETPGPLSLAPSYAVLCAVQAAIVLLPRRVGRPRRRGWIGIALPAAALGIGIVVLRAVAGGPHALALLAAIATPVLAAAGRKRAPLAVGAVARRLARPRTPRAGRGGRARRARCRDGRRARGELAPRWSLAVGLVVLAVARHRARVGHGAGRACDDGAASCGGAVRSGHPSRACRTRRSGRRRWAGSTSSRRRSSASSRAPPARGRRHRRSLRERGACSSSSRRPFPATVPTLAGLLVGRL